MIFKNDLVSYFGSMKAFVFIYFLIVTDLYVLIFDSCVNQGFPVIQVVFCFVLFLFLFSHYCSFIFPEKR